MLSRLVLIALVMLCLFSLTSKAQGYEPYIRLHYRGDTIPVDTAVVLDIYTYRTIKNYKGSSDEALSSKLTLINALEKQAHLGDSIIAVQRFQLEMMSYVNQRKDSVISQLSSSFNQMEFNNTRITNMFEEKLNEKNPIFTDERLWIGVGIGFVVAVFLTR